ncbi:MAG: hypothetical protein VX768_21740 [Planctomycetota bacterium]|nr:hypothetical protein [Planctomycetota bacterium]
MNLKTQNIFFFISLAALFYGLSPLDADTVDTISGRGFRGKISGMNANTITVTTSGGEEQNIPAHTVKRITFDGEPNALRSARRSMSEGQYNRVEEVLETVKPGNTLQAVEKEYLIAMASSQLALRGEGGKTVANSRKALEAFITNQNNTKWYQYFQALETFGDLEVASNNLPAAMTQYEKLSRSSSSEIKMLGQFKAASVNVLLGKYGPAKTAFDAVQKAGSDDSGAVKMKLLAKIGGARCSAESGDAAASIATILEIIKNEDPSDMRLFGNAYNALGHCYVKDGQKKAALLAFLHTDVLYQRDAEIHAEALYQLATLWQDDKKPGQSRDAQRLLTTKYQNTYWGSKAQAARLNRQ